MSMQRVQRIWRTMVRVVLPSVIMYTLINMYLLAFFHRESSETTFILKEKIVSSSKDLPELRDKFRRDDYSINPRQFENTREGQNKISEHRFEMSPKDSDVKRVKDPKVVMKDKSIDRMIEKLKTANDYSFFPIYYWNSSLHGLTRRLGVSARRSAKILPGYAHMKPSGGKMPAWESFHRNIRQFSLYDPDDPNVYSMLIEIATLSMIEAEENEDGTQLKMVVKFSNGGRAIIKFMRYPRDVEADENRFVFDDLERHVAEIAAFQLDKILGFYRVPPTIGRRVNITSELKPIMPRSIRDTVFKSPAGNVCFYGICDYYCDSGHAFCGHPDMMEISVQSYLPSTNIATRNEWYQPWCRSYNLFKKEYWEKHDDLCDSIRNEYPYNNGKLLLDMIDAHTFDFLTGNKDRHSFTTFTDFGNYTFPIMYDNGRGNISLHDLTRRLGIAARQSAKGLPWYDNRTQSTSGKMPAWKLFHRNIRQFSLYDPDDPNMYIMLNEIATLPIIEADANKLGTQLKINVRFSNEGRALLKFMRYPRHVEVDENLYIFDDMERHVAEIAAFQLDKILWFYRVPPTIGRRINITSELEPILPESIMDTLFTSPAGNLCFYGECEIYCDSAHAVCGHPDIIEVSAQSYFPSRNIAGRWSWYQPWKRSYNKFRKAYWEEHGDLCESIRNKSPYNNGKLLLDMVDAHTFDFLTGNKDRHSFTTFIDFGNYTFPIMFDNGRGFGRQTYDAMSILAPLPQCCLIRKSTLLKYVKLYVGPERLSVLMEKALEADPIAPVLIKPHLNALDRRMLKILQAVAECIEKHPVNKVVIFDRF